MRTKSLVWQFYDRVLEDDKCVAVTCKLCDSQYKFFGNTTNLRVHLSHKHPIQWELLQNGNLDASSISALEDDEGVRSKHGRRYSKNYKDDPNVNYAIKRIRADSNDDDDEMPRFEIQTVEVQDDYDNQGDDTNSSIQYIKQIGPDGEEEWLEEPFIYEPKRKRRSYKKIKKEIDDIPHNLQSYIVEESPYRKQEKVVMMSPKRDEFSVFGEYVAGKLRNFSEPKTRSNLQQLITTVLWQAEYGMYAETDTVKRLLLSSLQETPDSRVVHEQPVNEVMIENLNVTSAS